MNSNNNRKTFTHVSGLKPLTPLHDEIIDNKRYYTTPSGMKLPSVTTVLGHFKKASLQKWVNRVGVEEADRIKNRAATRGTEFHNMMERYLRNEALLFEEGMMPSMKQSFFDAKSEVDKIDNIHYIESSLYSEKLGVAGRTDVIGEYDETLSIIDFKTSLKPKKEEWIDNYFEQGTAYSLMCEELTNIRIDQIVIIISVNHEDEPQVFIKNRKNYIDSLINKIELYKKEA